MEKEALILIVDDNNKNIQVLGNLLKEDAYQVAVAMNGLQAIQFVKEKQPDLILLDVMMPELDGYETCRQIKSDPKNRLIPIIFLTAKNETDDLIEGFDAGGIDYVTKPFNHLELKARVKTHVELKRMIEENMTLKGILPICAKCKSIRNDKGYWQKVEEYFSNHNLATFTHTLCRKCADELYGNHEWYIKKKDEK